MQSSGAYGVSGSYARPGVVVEQHRWEAVVRRGGFWASLLALVVVCAVVVGFYLTQVLPFLDRDREKLAEWANGENWAQALYAEIFALRGWSTPQADAGLSPEGLPAAAGPFFGRALDPAPAESFFGRVLNPYSPTKNAEFVLDVSVLAPTGSVSEAPRQLGVSSRQSLDLSAVPLGPSSAPLGGAASVIQSSALALRGGAATTIALAALPLLAYGFDEWDRKQPGTVPALSPVVTPPTLVDAAAPEQTRVPPRESAESDQGDQASEAETPLTTEAASEAPAAGENEIFGGITKESTPLSGFDFVASLPGRIEPLLPEQGVVSEVFSTLLSAPPGPPPLFSEAAASPDFFVSSSGDVLPAPPAGPDDSTPAGVFESAIQEAGVVEAVTLAPEPATLWLLASGLISLGVAGTLRRRR